jgi:xanthine dehydrogenase accessory factor
MVMDLLRSIEAVIDAEEFGAVVTVIKGAGMGARALMYPDGTLREGQLPAELVEDLAADVVELVRHEQSRAVTYESHDVFVEPLIPPPNLIIFGAVHIAQALTSHATMLGYQVTVSDARPAFLTQERFPEAVTLLSGWPEDIMDQVHLDARTYIVLLSHDPRFEDPVLRLALASDAKYVGAMGSRRTHIKRVEKLREEGFSQEQIERIHGPVGLDIGAEEAGEVAISILAEMIHARYGSGTGVSLRGRSGRIHRQRTQDKGDV